MLGGGSTRIPEARFHDLLSRAFLVRFGADPGSDAEGGHIHASLLLRYFFGWVAHSRMPKGTNTNKETQ